METKPEPAVCEWIDRESRVHLFRLSERNKHSLLQDAAQTAAARLVKSKAFLSRLQKLSPDFANQFSIRETAISAAPLRLLVKHDSKLVADPSFQVQSFIVLSYCWHNPSWSPAPNFSRRWWPISDLMMQLLLRYCGPEEGVWIDQLCIHQDDLEELRLAVSAMDQIYKCARQMYAVLEDIELTEEDQKIAIAYVGGGTLLPKVATNFVLKIASARWFSRAWCSYELKMTEYVVERRPLLMIPLAAPDTGIWQLEATGFIPNQMVMNYVKERQRNHLELAQQSLLRQYLGFLLPVAERPENGKKHDENIYPPLQIQRLYMITQLGCTFVTDYIAIMLNTSGIDIVHHGCVTTSDELHWVVSALALAAGDPAVLSAAGTSLRLLPKNEENVVSWTTAGLQHKLMPKKGPLKISSWVHNFTQTDWIINGRLPENSGINSFTEEMIDLDLLILSDTPTQPCAAAIACATAFIDACYEVNCPTLAPYYTFTDIDRAKTREHLAKNVATILDLGLDWIRSAWCIFQKDMIAADARWTTRTWNDPELWGPIQRHLLPYLLQSSPPPKLAEPISSQDQNQPESDYKLLLLPFLSFFLAIDVRGGPHAPSIIRTGPASTDFALYDHQNSNPLPAVKFAVPVCLASSRFQRCMRVWVLEEMAEGGEVPTAGTAGINYLFNQTQRFGGTVKSEPWGENPEDGLNERRRMVVEKGSLDKRTWDGIQVRMAANQCNQWMVGKTQGDEALQELNRPSGCWVLVEKGVLWGCNDIVEDGRFVTLKKGQRIWGEARVGKELREETARQAAKEMENLNLAEAEDDGNEVGEARVLEKEAAGENKTEPPPKIKDTEVTTL